MSKYNYIKISLYGQVDDSLKTTMRFPSPVDGQPETKMTVFNPTKVLEQFNSARECYAIWKTAAGCYFGMVTRNPLEPASGAMLLSMMIPHGIVFSGRQIISALSALKKTIIEEKTQDDDSIIRTLASVGLPENPIINADIISREKEMELPADQQPKGTGYRTYANGHELDTILSFPYQDEYRLYRRVLIVSATSSLKPGAPLARLASPIDREFWVECPADVTATPTSAVEGDRITLMFSKPGFTPSKQIITAGIPSPYARIDGSVIKIKTAAECGLSFSRRIRLNVTSAKGGAVHGYTISVNGRSVNTIEPVIELTEHDMTTGRPVQINIASNNFRPIKLEKNPAELASIESLDIVLEPLEQGILLRLDFGEGRIFEQQISIERNTPEYSQLHSGNFHGFRASRISGQGLGEAYNIDVRAASKPTAPSFDNVSGTSASQTTTTSETNGRKIPFFENISRSNRNNSATTTSEAPEHEKNTTNAETTTPSTATSGSVLESIWGSKTKDGDEKPLGGKMAIILGVAASVVLLALALIFFLPTSTNPDEKVDDPDVITAHNIDSLSPDVVKAVEDANLGNETKGNNTAATTAPVADNTPATPAADEQADISYLNQQRVWKISDLKTQKYRDLVAAIQKGDIEAMAAHDYFAVSGRATNKEAVQMVEMAWKAIGTPNEGGNRTSLRKNEGRESIDIHVIYEDLARRKPSKPNQNPRPSR